MRKLLLVALLVAGALLPANVRAAEGPTKAIARVWSGRVKAARADEYYTYLVEAGIKKIQAIEGNLGVQVLRRTEGDVTEFTVISYWGSVEAIKRFAGEDYEKTHHLPRDPEFLLELSPRVKHYEVMINDVKRVP